MMLENGALIVLGFFLAGKIGSQSQTGSQSPAKFVTQTPSLTLPPPDSGVVAEPMVTIPAEDFLYGDDKALLSLPAYKIDKTEVTVEAYELCVQSGHCSKPKEGGNCTYGLPSKKKHPVNCLDWNQAYSYCEWAGKRLPTEKEWEKAARGIDGRTYPWGEEGVSCERVIMSERGKGCGKNGTWPVCSRAKGNSPFGLCDMIGNVWEWTADWYDDSNTYRVVRGGSWQNPKSKTKSHRTLRLFNTPTYRFDTIGFRCAQDGN